MTEQQFRCLIIDDTLTNILILKTPLINFGYIVDTAQSGKEGRILAKKNKPDLILLDIMMPGEDGFETIAKLKADSETSNIPVIFLTAMSDIDSKLKGFELGAVDFVTKPFHKEEIKARVALHIKLNIATKAMIELQAQKLKEIADAQTAMLQDPSELPDANFAFYYQSLCEAGGDFFDVIKISNDIYGYFLGDVAGHDLGTSFVTAAVKGLLQQNCNAIYKPKESMAIMNNVLIDTIPMEKYLTGCYVTLNRKSNEMTIVNMGHPPMIYKPLNGSAKLLEFEGDILGMFNDVIYHSEKIKVEKGDRFYLYSDGLIERVGAGEIWSGNLDNLVDYVNAVQVYSLEESITKLKEFAFSDGVPPDDDVVILGVEV